MGNMIFAVVLSPGGVIAWLVVGLIAGWLAGLMMKGSGYGILGDIVVGLIGSLVGGLILSFFVVGAAGFWGSILVAFIGACVLIFALRAFSGRDRWKASVISTSCSIRHVLRARIRSSSPRSRSRVFRGLLAPRATPELPDRQEPVDREDRRARRARRGSAGQPGSPTRRS